MSDQYNATVVSKSYLTDSLFFLKVNPDDGIKTFIPGQYIALGLTGDAPRCATLPPEEIPIQDANLIRRSYSIGSSPLDTEGYEFYIALLPQGVLTARLAALNIGDRLFIGRKPVGTFCITELPAGHPVLFVSTGTGIAPFVSMLREGTIFSTASQITVLHGVRFATDFGYGEELAALAQTHPHFSYHQIVSRESPGWSGVRGYVQDFITNGTVTVDPVQHHVMLCGNPGMIDDLEKLLVGNGFVVHSKKTPGNLHLEKYW